MRSVSSPAESAPRRFLPAWVISLFFHSCLLALLIYVVKPWPQGGAGGNGGFSEIVLEPMGAGGDSGVGDAEAAPQEALDPSPPVDLMTDFLKDFETTEVTDNLFQIPETVPMPAAATARTQARAGGGSGNGGSPGGGRGDTNVSVFGVQGRGNKFIYLFDRSSSMQGAPLAAAKRQLLQSMESLESIHRFHVMFFNTKRQSLNIASGKQRMESASDRNKQLAANFVGGITADGGTDRLTALREAIGLAPDVIFFLTDADDPMTSSELADIAAANGRAQAAICVIEFGRRPAPLPDNFLMRLARESGGQYGYVNTTSLTN
jgi:hypothetical protein